MPTLLVRSTLASVDLTLDGFSNDFVYSSSTGAVSDVGGPQLSGFINNFYNTLASGATARLITYMAQSLNKSAPMSYTCYNITGHLDGSAHGAPIWQNTQPLTNPVNSSATTAIPEGVAAVLSFRRDYGTDVEFIRDSAGKVIGRPRGQDRGRIFFGPLDPTALARQATTLRCTLSNPFMTDIGKAWDSISTFSDSASAAWHLAQWSRKKASAADIVQVWIDDRPDYQRRRSDQSVIRSTLPFAY